jgi:hypothetical protein
MENTQEPAKPGTLKQSFRRKIKARHIIALLIIYPIFQFLYYGIPENIDADMISPSGKYRVETYIAHSPYAFFAYRKAFFIKVYNTDKKAYVYTSNLDETYAMTPIFWPEECAELDMKCGLSVSMGISVIKSKLE